MFDAEPEAIAPRWIAAVREGGRSGTADVLARWLVDEGGALDALGDASLDARALLERVGGAFARLGGAACAAGLSVDELAAAIDALREVLGADADERARSGLAALHGLAVGGWHADGHRDAGGRADGASGDPFAHLDPAVGRLIRHDIKTPLQAASLNLELLAMEQEGNPDVTGAIATIMQSLDSAVAMLRRFDDV